MKEVEVRILVVDDSALVRQLLVSLLSEVPGFEVSATPDGVTALERVRLKRPDVIVLDLEMPRMDGLTFLRKLMAEDPLPVVVCSTAIGESASAAMDALAAGAVDVIAKPRVGVREFLESARDDLAARIRGAAAARVRRLGRLPEPPLKTPSQKRLPAVGERRWVVAIGASTGGTEALYRLLPELPTTSPALLIVQHMPDGFTAAFARHLDRRSAIEVKEAEPGDLVLPGRALVARAGFHLVAVRNGSDLEVRLDGGPPVCHVRPSADVLFSSVARVCGRQAVGIVLTGMGSDGADGLLELRRAGARTVVQDEHSSVVFGMPKVAIARGAASEVLALEAMAGVIAAGPLAPASP